MTYTNKNYSNKTGFFGVVNCLKKNATPILVLGMSIALWTDGDILESMLDRRLFSRIFANTEQV